MRVFLDVLRIVPPSLALSSTIFALIDCTFLKGLKIYLYGRLAHSVEAGLEGVV